ncbi:ABC transporter ATP-binding protein [Aeromicrobium panaciterrae]|uniref:ABC transporter ATP-binding protein n=1 Tax=Aeromicrobium panaciterrae TaxID=363861 RepID=UPI0031DE5543
MSVLKIRGLGIDYVTHHYREVAVSDLDLTVEAGQVVAVVGESGSGKTSVAKAIVGLLPSTAELAPESQIVVNGVDVVGASEAMLRALRGAVVSFVPQDPRRSLHPLKRIGAQIAEVLLEHDVCTKDEVDAHVIDLIDRVGIDQPDVRARQYPHEFSGGMLQRVLIAIAIAAKPALIIADEPTSALDVTIQKQVLSLLVDIVADDGVSILLVTHDLELAARYSDATIVLRGGRVVERRSTGDFFAGPITDYTRALLRSSPTLQPRPIDQSLDDRPVVLEVDDIRRSIRLRSDSWWGKGELFTPVDGVTFRVPRASTVAVVGESGAGKTSIARLVLGLDKPDSGRVIFEGADVHQIGREARRALRRKTQLIPQNPASSFDPRYSVAQVIAEPLIHDGLDRSAVGVRVAELLDQVGLPSSFANKGALELSGGQQQRVAIARAISLNPRLVVCDEPTSALDVTVQARIIELLLGLQKETGVSYLFISHNLAVVSELADTVVVLNRGRVVESGHAADVLGNPSAEYTRELIASVPHRREGVQ